MVSLSVERVSLAYSLRQRSNIGERLGKRRSVVTDPRLVIGKHLTALNDVTFSLSSGDRLGLVGTNGAGKTTLLKVIYGIYRPTVGIVKAAGRMDALFDVKLGFNPEATGRRNMILRGLINGWSDDEISERMSEATVFSELGDFIDLPLKFYSAGMAARLAFSIATSFDPEILLLDEWIGAGDASFQSKAKDRMADLANRAGIVILASHNNSLLKKICNKILVLDKGSVIGLYCAEEWFSTQSKR